MTVLSKTFVGAVVAGAMAMVPVTAASAQSRYDRGRGISAGDVIAGAVVLGGIAAVAGSLGRRGYDNRYDNRYYRGGNYGYNGYNGDPRGAVEQCVSAASNDARSRGYSNAQVTQVRNVDDTSYGWKVRGNLVVDAGGGYYDRGSYGNSPYDSRYNGAGYYGGSNYGRYNNGYGYNRSDSGSFTCWIDRGQVSRMDYSGIRGM